MEKVIWKPTPEFLRNSNIALFMKRHAIASYEELISKSTQDIEWFWNACLKDLKVEGTVKLLPTREEMSYPVNEQYIVELYSK
jgi:ribosomal protein S4